MKVKVSCRVVAKNDTPLYLLKKHLNSIEAVQNFVPFENIKGVSNQTLLLCMQQRQNGCRLNTLAFQRTLLYINLNRQIWRVKIHMSNRKLLHLIQEKTIWWFPKIYIQHVPKSTASTELTEPFVAQQIFKISAIVHLSSQMGFPNY